MSRIDNGGIREPAPERIPHALQTNESSRCDTGPDPASRRAPARGRNIYVLGRPTRAAFEVAVDQYRQGGFMSEYDAHIANKLAYVITGGALTSPQEVSEQYLLDLEREGFLELLGERRTQDRIEHMLKNKKALRN